MGERANNILEDLGRRLKTARRRIVGADLLVGALTATALLVVGWTASIGLEAALWLGPDARTGLVGFAAVVTMGVLAWFVVRPALHAAGFGGLDQEGVAHKVGIRYPALSDRLINILQLSGGEHSPASNEIVGEAVVRLGAEIQPVPFEHISDLGRARRAARRAVLPVAAAVLLFALAPTSLMQATGRLASPRTEFAPPAPFTLEVLPGSTSLVRGTPLSVRAVARGSALPDRAELEFRREAEQVVQRVTMQPDGNGGFRHELINLRADFRYRVRAAGVASPWYTVRVLNRPRIETMRLSLTYPSYSRIPRQTLPPDIGDVTALRGTRVDVSLDLTGAVASDVLVVHDHGHIDSLVVSEAGAAGSFRVWRSGTYRVIARSSDALENESPIAYQIEAISDESPVIRLLSPPQSAELADSHETVLEAEMSDDFGFRRLDLRVRLAESRFKEADAEFSAIDVPLAPGPETTRRLRYQWAVGTSTGLDPVPGDVIEYYLEVWDNDAVAGSKSASTAVHRLVMPSLADKMRAVEEKEDAAEELLEELLDESAGIRREFDDLEKSLREDPSADWEDQRQLESLEERQTNLEERVESLSETLNELNERLSESDMVTPETLQMFEELQKVVDEINSPDLMDALQELKESLNEMDLQQMQESMDEFRFSEQQYQQRLERSLDLMKQIRVQQELEQAAELARDLAETEEMLQEKTAQLAKDSEQRSEDGEQPQQAEPAPDSSDESKLSDEERAEALAREQERAADDMRALEEALRKVEERMKELRQSPQQGVNEMNEQLDREDMPRQMEQNAEQLRNQELDTAQQGQQQMQQKLQQMQQQMQQMGSSMQGMQMQMNLAGMRRALSDVLTLSARQEILRARVNDDGADGQVLRDMAQAQVALSEGLSTVSDSLLALASRIPQMSAQVQSETAEALREMGAATTAMGERVSRRAVGHQRSGMMHLNELALLLSDLLTSMMNQQGGQGASMDQLMQQLQQMSGQQQQLNQQIQQLLNDMHGQRLTGDMQQRMRQIAEQQDAIRRQLKEMARNPELRGKVLGDLSRIAEQMEETVRELEQRRAGRRMVERQQQILTRLLESTRSLQERGRERKRESRTGEDLVREGPEGLPPAKEIDRLRRDLIRALDAGYAPDYEELIKRYFDLLQEAAGRPAGE